MKLSDKSAIISSLRQDFRYQYLMTWKVVRAISMHMVTRWILTGQKGSAAWRANGRLGVRSCEGNTVFNEFIEVGSVDVGIPKTVNGIITLLVCAVPQNVRFVHELPPNSEILKC
jgi:hypothetical protein